MSRRRPAVSRLEDRTVPAQVGPPSPFTLTEVLVGVRGDEPLAALAATDAADRFDFAASRVIYTHEQISAVELQLADGVHPAEALAALRPVKQLAWSQYNRVHIGEDPRLFTPNDPQHADQYHLGLMQAYAAWDTTTGSPSVVVAVVDDGIALSHPDLSANLWKNAGEIAGNGIDDDNNGYTDDVNGWDTTSNDNNPNPTGSGTHGTHVAGIIAATTNNATGVAGIAGGGPNGSGARIMPLRWYNYGAWTSSMVATGFAYAAQNGAKILNASYNMSGWVNDAAVRGAMDFGYDQGMLYLISAGNSNTANFPHSNYREVLMVASSDSGDVRSSFSNYGDWVDIIAPGSNVLATVTNAGGTDNGYGSLSGTSMSSPASAAVAALIWSKNPAWSRDQVAAQLMGTADNIDAQNPNFVNQLGRGRANANRGVTETLAAPRMGTFTSLPDEGATVTKLTTFRVTNPWLFDPASVTAANFDLRGDGPDNTFGTADDRIIPLSITSPEYQVGSDSIGWVVTQALTSDRYRFTAKSGPGGLRNPFGTALDGNGDGTAGDDFTRTFFVGNSATGVVFEDRDGDGVYGLIDRPVAGATVYVDANDNGTLDTGVKSFAATGLPLAITSATPTVTSELTVSGLTGFFSDVNLSLNVAHTWTSDLVAYLTGPTGTKIELFNDVGGNGDNFSNTVFDDQAAAAITAGAPPFAGSFRPNQPLAAFNGTDPNGVWTLTITDTFPTADDGALDGWSLQVATGELTQTTAADGIYSAAGAAAGPATLRLLPPAGFGPLSPADGSTKVNLPSDTAHDFAVVKLAAVSGRVYRDFDADGAFDAGEPGLAGVRVYSDANGNGQFDTNPAKAFAATDVPQTINDFSTAVSNLTVSGQSGVLTNVRVKLSLTHTWDGDLTAYLYNPGGEKVLLFSGVGGSGDNFTNTWFDDAAAVSITSGTAPFTGTFRPQGSLAAFHGGDANGTWKLALTDDFDADQGKLTAWTLELTTGEATALTDADGGYQLRNLTGPQTIRVVPPVGLAVTAPADGQHVVTVSANTGEAGRLFGLADLPPAVTQLQINGGAAQRSMVRSIRVNFSESVQLPADAATAFALTGPNGKIALTATVAVGAASVLLTFSGPGTSLGSLDDGVYTLTIDGDLVTDSAGQKLADYTSAANGIFRLYGDGSGDGKVDFGDFLLFRASFGTADADFDIDGSGTVDFGDFLQFRTRFGTTVLP